MTKTIEITVDAEGRSTVETKGFAGPSCRDASRSVEAALGMAVAERLTPAFHAADVTRHQVIRLA